jgi:cytochrome P450
LTGQYTFQLPALHAKYGPIIRINPREVHIADADFYDTIYPGPGQKRDKWEWFTKSFPKLEESFFAAAEHDQHRKRRAPLNPFFSKAKVVGLLPVITERSEALCQRLEEFKTTGEIMPAQVAFAAVANGTFGPNPSS